MRYFLLFLLLVCGSVCRTGFSFLLIESNSFERTWQHSQPVLPRHHSFCLWSVPTWNFLSKPLSVAQDDRNSKENDVCQTNSPFLYDLEEAHIRYKQQGQKAPSIYCHALPFSKDSETKVVTSRNANPWNILVPPLLSSISKSKRQEANDARVGPDITMEWNLDDDPQLIAKKMVAELCTVWDGHYRTNTIQQRQEEQQKMIDYLTQSMNFFRHICCWRQQLNVKSFRARIVATRGPAGTKCPQWHVDHVPLRWIQSLVGQGCQVVRSNDCNTSNSNSNDNSNVAGVSWDYINGLDQTTENDDETEEFAVVKTSVQQRNHKLVNPKVAPIYQAKELEAVVLLGNQWNDSAKKQNNCCDGEPLMIGQPAVHKSPAPIPWWEGRVLLTQDVILESS